ncbi:MAG: amidohydrolase family protein [Oscillospiraceae bacterium]|nr:amidohydrolase family protein [Oscillospiraceae bacterium]
MKNSKLAFINGVILSGEEGMEPLRGHILFTNGDRIEAIRPDGADTAGYQVIDLAGAALMPGLINLHVHIPATGKPKKKQTDAKKLVKLLTSNALMRKICYGMCGKYVRPQLLSGVTTIRAVGGVQDMDSRLRDEIAAGKRVGPRILAANMAVSVPGGHMAGSLAYEAHSAQEAAAFVRKIAEDRPDLIKLMITGGVLDATKRGEPGELKMPPDYVRAACDEAHRLGLKVAAHVESPEGVKVALENGVDTIEHGAKPDAEMIALFKERGAALVATISPALPFALFDRSLIGATEVQQYNGNIVFEGIIDCAKACLEAGVPVGLGTDTGCPYITHYDMWREVNYFQKYCGVSNAFALYTATLGNAKIVGLDKELGSLAPGKCADLIVTVRDPLEDLTALRDVSMVVSRGEIVDISGLKKYPDCEKELDKYL